MGKSNSNATKNKSGIPCIEVLISRSHINTSSTNLHWTLSVYSLENQPVRKNRVAILDFEAFHFMVYDWNRTIRSLLEDRQIPYSIVKHFNRDTIYSDVSKGNAIVPDNTQVLVAGLGELPDGALVDCLPDVRQENADLLN